MKRVSRGGLPHLSDFGHGVTGFRHGGGWELNVISGGPWGGQEEGRSDNEEGFQTPDDPYGVGG